jgi:hypothetical protein
MTTELTPNSRSLPTTSVVTGLPKGNGLWVPHTQQHYALGSVCRPDDRSFYYGKSGAACLPGFVAKLWPQYFFASGTTLAAAANGYSDQYTGDKRVRIVNTSQTIAVDQFAGGILTVGHGRSVSSPYSETRKILGNSASAATPGTESITVYLDHPLYYTQPAATFVELMVNPYSDIRGTASDLASAAGIAPAGVTDANLFAWFQTWGPCWLNPGGAWASQGVNDERAVVMVGDGSINGAGAITLGTGYQVIGHIIQRDTSGSGGPPWIDLRIKY